LFAINFDFKKKKETYKGKNEGTTAFMISKDILRKRKWTINHVKERQKWMVNQITSILDIKIPDIPKLT